MCWDQFLKNVKRKGDKFVPAKGVTVYCDFFDRHTVTTWGACTGPASSPPEFDYEELEAEGLVVLSPEVVHRYFLMCAGERQEMREAMETDSQTDIEGDVIPFTYDEKLLKLETRYVGELWGSACLMFTLAVQGNRVVGHRSALY
jgi:hypothetical protein